jgi:hypothetical protein
MQKGSSVQTVSAFGIRPSPPLIGYAMPSKTQRAHTARRHKSVGGRMRNATDRLMGWVIVTIVGSLTAVAAFLIVWIEQWLFDVKYGYCVTGWWKPAGSVVQCLRSVKYSTLPSAGQANHAVGTLGRCFYGDRLFSTIPASGCSTYALSAVRLGYVLIQGCVNFRSYSL